MQAYDVERSIADGRGCVEALFEFILENAENLEAHETEKAASKMILPLGLAAIFGANQNEPCPAPVMSPVRSRVGG